VLVVAAKRISWASALLAGAVASRRGDFSLVKNVT